MIAEEKLNDMLAFKTRFFEFMKQMSVRFQKNQSSCASEYPFLLNTLSRYSAPSATLPF